MRDEPEGMNSNGNVLLGDFFPLGMPDDAVFPMGIRSW
jgi:hypothetical protein